jgi:hypothetical protein
LAFKVEPFQLVHTKWPSFLNIFYVLDAYDASIYIARHLEKMTNNMGQTFEREKHFMSTPYYSVLVHTTLFLNKYVRYIN